MYLYRYSEVLVKKGVFNILNTVEAVYKMEYKHTQRNKFSHCGSSAELGFPTN